MIKFTIEKAAISWNKIYSSGHWGIRKAIVDEWHEAVRYALYQAKIPRNSINGKVIIHIIAYMNKPIDPDNICAKVIIDPLVDWGIIKDDSYHYIHSVTLMIVKLSPKDKKTNFIDVALIKVPKNAKL